MMTAERRAAGGGIVWLGFVAAVAPNPRDDTWAHALLLLAALVLLPLVLDLIIERNDPQPVVRWLRWVRLGQFPAGVLLAWACWMRPGTGAAGLALPWLGMTVLLAATGAARILRHGAARPLDRLATDAALLFSAVGGLWMVADRAGFGPLGFSATVVALTAVHFHYAGLLLPIFTGQVLRRMPDSRFVGRVTVGVVLGVPAVAVGITASQLGWGPALETATGTGLALAGAIVGVLHVRVACREPLPGPARALLAIAGVSLCCGMILAGLYALRAYVSPFPWLGIPQMRALHGTINALGFGLCGVLGWRAAMAERTS